MRDHTTLKAWKKADEIAVAVYRATAGFPKSEAFGLTYQMRKCAVSVPSNIVEGCARHTQADFVRFLDIAFGSLKEMRYQWSLSHRLGYCAPEAFEQLDLQMEEAVRTLAGLIKSLRR